MVEALLVEAVITSDGTNTSTRLVRKVHVTYPNGDEAVFISPDWMNLSYFDWLEEATQLVEYATMRPQ